MQIRTKLICINVSAKCIYVDEVNSNAFKCSSTVTDHRRCVSVAGHSAGL